MAERASLSIGIVAYNALDKLRACLDSLARQQVARTVEVIVVDNQSTEPVAEMVRRDYPTVTLLEPGRNLGFAGGTNLALGAGRGDLLLWLNPDTEMPETDTLERFCQRLEAAGDGVGVLGCRLVRGDGSPQGIERAATVGSALRSLLHLLPAHQSLDPAGEELVAVDYICGAALLCRREVWAQVGELDPEYFMYFEDLDWCRRARQQGWPSWLDPTVTIVHHEGASYGDRAYRRLEHYWSALLHYLGKFEGRAAVAAVRVGLLVTALVKFPVVALLDRSPKRAGRLSLLRRQVALGWHGRRPEAG